MGYSNGLRIGQSLSNNSADLATQVVMTPRGVTGKSYFPITANLIDDAQYSQVTGSGGWQVVDRPKNVAATQWYDRSPFQLQMTLVFQYDMLKSGHTVDDMCNQLESWVDPIPNTYQPPVFTISGPVPGGRSRLWFVYSIQFEAAIRDKSTGERLQQGLQITCYEYQSPIPGSGGHAKSKQNPNTTATIKYRVTTATTLQQIASNRSHGWKKSSAFPSMSRWIAEVGKLNNITDPRDATKISNRTLLLPV